MSVADIRMNQHFEPVGIYARGFLDAAAALFERADRGEGLVDYAFYPSAYCLRHGVELFVKQMSIYAAYEAHDQSLLYVPGHDLAKAWAPLSEHVTFHTTYDLFGDDKEQALGHIDAITTTLEELHELDPRSTLLRYPEDVFVKNGKARKRKSTPAAFDVVNLADWAAIANATSEAAHYLLNRAEDRVQGLAQRRGDPPINFHETVMRKVKR